MLIDTQPRAAPLGRLHASAAGDAAAPDGSARWALLAAILAAAAALRLGTLGSNSLWFDEALVARLTQLPWPAITATLAARDVHPPLYFFLMKAWTGLAGTSEVGLRLPSALASVFGVWLTYALLRQIASERAALLGALLVCLSPFDVMAAQEARMYALLETLTLASTLALILAISHGGRLRWAAYAGISAAMAYTHNLGLCVLAAHGLWVAGFERCHLRGWLLAACGATLLYAAWIPALWHQFAVVELHHAWFRRPVGWGDLAGLFGLFAFGGSLFGMPGFFDNGTLAPATQWLLLAPFLLLAGHGLTGGAVDLRRRVLLGGCLALPITTMLLISLIKPAFYPRWFSFLLPFSAMLTALGLEDLAKRVPVRRAALPLLAAGVLVCGMPVLIRYYVDPGFHPYRWRDAATLVRAEAHRGDFILYVHSAAEIAFGYYFREPHPSLTLNPIEAFGEATARPGFTAAQARALASRYPRVWLIIVTPFDEQMQRRLLPALNSAFALRELHDFGRVLVGRLESTR